MLLRFLAFAQLLLLGDATLLGLLALFQFDLTLLLGALFRLLALRVFLLTTLLVSGLFSGFFTLALGLLFLLFALRLLLALLLSGALAFTFAPLLLLAGRLGQLTRIDDHRLNRRAAPAAHRAACSASSGQKWPQTPRAAAARRECTSSVV